MPQIVDLTCPFDREYTVPQYLHHAWRLEFKHLFTFPRDGQRVTEFTMSTHTGTHVDAPSHVLENGKTLDAFSLSAFYGTGVVLGFPRGELGKITAADLQKYSNDICEGDIVMLCTGWGKYFVEDPKDTYFIAAKQPGLTEDGAQWLADRKIKAVGIDVFSIRHPGDNSEVDMEGIRPGTYTERIPIRGKIERVHEILMTNDILIIEQLTNLESIAGKRATFSLFPLPFVGMDGAPVRAIAILD